jgi:hypothetical protein
MRTRIATTGLAVTALLAATCVATARSDPAQAAPACKPAWALETTPAPPNSTLLNPLPLPGASDAVSSSGAVVDSVNVVGGSSVWFGGHSGAGPWTLRWNGQRIEQAPQQISLLQVGGLAPTYASSFDSDTDGWSLVSPPASVTAGFAQRWHGGRWTTTPLGVSPDPAAYQSRITDVSAISPSNAWVVGTLYPPAEIQGLHPVGALIEHWDGTRWSVVPNPASTQAGVGLVSVTARSANDVWAVGETLSQDPDEQHVTPLIEHYDGTRWTVFPAPPVPDTTAVYARLATVSASGTGNVWAVGVQVNAAGANNVPFAVHFDGNRWSLAGTMPDPGSALSSIYGASATDAWATAQNPITNVASFLHWDGKSWTIVPPPGPREWGLVYNYTAIDGTGPDDIWATGYVENATYGVFTPQIAHLSCHR